MLLLCTAESIASIPLKELKVWVDKEFTLTADGKTVTKITVYQNSPYTYTAFNLELRVPKGVKINKVKQGREMVNDIKLSERATSTHNIACNMPIEGLVKIISTSTLNHDFYPDDAEGNPLDELFTIGFITEDTAINGEYEIELFGCDFVINDKVATTHTLDHIEHSTFKIEGGVDFPGVDYRVTMSKCGTLILPFNCAIPAGMKVYECEGVNPDNTLKLKQVAEISANTPYIIEGTPDSHHHFTGIYRALKDEYSTPYMTGVYVQGKVPQGAYVMQHKSWGFGFYKVGKSDITIKPYRCYLNKLDNNMASSFELPFGSTTGVQQTETDINSLVDVYSTDGKLLRKQVSLQKSLTGLPKGIYIINDKKYVVE